MGGFLAKRSELGIVTWYETNKKSTYNNSLFETSKRGENKSGNSLNILINNDNIWDILPEMVPLTASIALWVKVNVTN